MADGDNDKDNSSLWGWIHDLWRCVREDAEELFVQRNLPVHVEVTLRATATALFSYILALASLPKIIPESQRVIISMVGPILGLMFPSLLFSVLALGPQMPFVVLLGLTFATFLLVCATSSLRLYVSMFGLVACILGFTRFDKKTGPMTAVLVMVTALNTQGFAETAHTLGLDFVKQLWKETGVQNSQAVMVNSVIGYLWILVAVLVGRILPPFRTLRALLSRGLLPSVLNDMAESLALKKQLLYGTDGGGDTAKKEDDDNDDDEVVDDSHFLLGKEDNHDAKEQPPPQQQQPEASSTKNEDRQSSTPPATPRDEDVRTNNDTNPESSLADAAAPATPKSSSSSLRLLEQQHDALIAKLSHSASLMVDGDLAIFTAFEPRLLRLGPPECSWRALQQVMVAIDKLVLMGLALSEYHESDDNRVVPLLDHVEPEMIVAHHDHASAALRHNANALQRTVPVRHSSLSSSSFAADNGIRDIGNDNNDDDDDKKNVEIAIDPEIARQGVSIPIFFSQLNQSLHQAIDQWARVMGPPDRTQPWFDRDGRAALKDNTLPLIAAGGLVVFKAVVMSFVQFFMPHYWKQVLLPPRPLLEKFVWSLKFGIGFAGLVVMYVYWPKYRNLEVPTNDSSATAHFAGWTLIAYSMATTQTAEGSAKKGLLRLLGTASGGFSGWLAVTWCGEDNEVGLIAWLTCFAALGAYIGLPRGMAARMGSHPDYGYGPAVFVMTQGLVAVNVYIGAGGKNDITVNRIVGNCIGIFMAIVLALIPPSIYGGNPKYARAVLESEQASAIFYMQRLLDYCEQRQQQQRETNKDINDDATKKSSVLSAEQVCEDIGNHMAQSKTKQLFEEAQDFYKDASKLHNLPLLKTDPKLGQILESLKVTGSGLATSMSFATFVLQMDHDDADGTGNDNAKKKKNKYSQLFLSDTKSRALLGDLLASIQKDRDEDYDKNLPNNNNNNTLKEGTNDESSASPSLGSKVFLLLLRKTVRELRSLEHQLDEIQWGIF